MSGFVRGSVVTIVAAALAGLISAQPDARSGPAPATVTVLEVQYVTPEECRAAWPVTQWPQASVCSGAGAPVSPRVTAGGGDHLTFTPPPRAPVTGRTLHVGPRASVTYLRSGAAHVRIVYRSAPRGP